ncbi:MAG: hypothetical protein B6U88_00295 [Candidatus Aenigmarchaeota archaeon ex4484_56]|nr:MAG: hypothetical protein B6U88_00295 [Candidatus Aenigmarchaeota archaeon ex4484_56]
MVFKRIFGRNTEEDDEEYIDLDKIIEEPKSNSGRQIIKIDKILEYKDAERVQKLVREGFIVLAETEELKNKDVGELRRVIERIKKTVTAIDGDVVMGPKSVLIICPGSVKVARE